MVIYLFQILMSLKFLWQTLDIMVSFCIPMTKLTGVKWNHPVCVCVCVHVSRFCHNSII